MGTGRWNHPLISTLEFPQTFQLLTFSTLIFFSSPSCPFHSHLGGGTSLGLVSPISNLPKLPTGQVLFPSCYK